MIEQEYLLKGGELVVKYFFTKNHLKTITFYKTINAAIVIVGSIVVKELKIKVKNRERISRDLNNSISQYYFIIHSTIQYDLINYFFEIVRLLQS